MSGKGKLAELISLFLKGIGIGAANTVPGVSGGTIAAITGIYDRLIHAISTFLSDWKGNLLVLLPILLGVLTGIATFASVVDYFLATYPQATAFFFIGLILGSVPFLLRQLSGHPFHLPQGIAFTIAAAVVIIMGVSGRPPITAPITALTLATGVSVFFAGVISAATMIIPGVSGSFVLLLIGMYSTFISAVRTGNLPLLAVLAVGSVVGIVAVSRLLDVLFRRFFATTYWAIVGLVAGSVAGIWPGFASAEPLWLSPAGLALGLALALSLGSRKGEKQREQQM
ncbi:MAG: DUF368 domain-containing protein [Spirochaetaceae bacterium]